MKFSGLISLATLIFLILPVTDLVAMEVLEGSKELLHDLGGLPFVEVLVLNDVVKELSAFAVPNSY